MIMILIVSSIIAIIIYHVIMSLGSPRTVVADHYRKMRKMEEEKRQENEDVISSPATVGKYITSTYEFNGNIDELMFKHLDKINEDADMRAFAYWTGDRIAKEEKLKEKKNVDNS